MLANKGYRFGILGCGGISAFYAHAIHVCKNAVLFAACDTNFDRLSSFPAGPKLYANPCDMLQDESVDCVIITLPNLLHHEYILKSLEYGKHVLCEKPLTLTACDAAAVFEKAASAGLTVMTAFHRRYNQSIQPLLANPSRYGSFDHIHAAYLEDIDMHSLGSLWYQDRTMCGGGCIIDNGTNVIDVLVNLLGDLKIESVDMQHVSSSKPEFKAKLSFSSANASVCIDLDWTNPVETKNISLFKGGSKIITLDMLGGFSKFKGSLWHEYECLLVDFLSVVNFPKNNSAVAEHDIKIVKIIEDTYKVAKS